ncbi:DUF1285 domain-containing protein [Shewanella ulleungensis]|jgi:hypothetical protein|uniref:DUF1285 domain-containing protein n=1 Tax=Shewanella ulleungensis TaxID=2282699 RepID=A0ABQ2QBM4_9GAMM|nr:DUF1285 domain-containing protein [Shewanella ulleungensis]MCL1149098.1 DUF1285 domain-containing protein [Shewanella ulleungensis]GGP73643.1 DUF1285 domain-containing protein [Shewanella ulleungensis]
MTDETAALHSYTHSEGAALCSEDVLFHILSSGDWLYLNSPLPSKFAALFSRILHCIDNEYYLITPVEKVRVTVDNYPLILVDYETRSTINPPHNTQLIFTSSIGTELPVVNIADVIVTDDGIYAPLTRGLVGQLNRACYYRYINEYLSFD